MKYLRWRPDDHYGHPKGKLSDTFVMPFTGEELLQYYEAAGCTSWAMGGEEGDIGGIFKEYGDFPVFHHVYMVPDGFKSKDLERTEDKISYIASDMGFQSNRFISSVEDYDSAFPPGTIMFGGDGSFTMRSVGDKYGERPAESNMVKQIASHIKNNLDSSLPMDYDQFIGNIMNYLPGFKAELDSLGFDWERAKALSKRARMLERE